MSQAMPPRTIELDFTQHGNADTVRARLFPEESRGLQVGDPVLLAGDSVDPQAFDVSSISADGREYTFVRH